MKGINPILFKISFLLVVLVSSILSLFYYGFVFVFIFSFILFGIAWTYCYIKIESTDKGKLLYKMKRPNVEILKFLFIVMIIYGSLKFLSYFTSNGLSIYISLLLSNLILGLVLFDDYLLGNPTIKFYERGVVFDRVAFYNWEELGIKEDGDNLTIKIKYYPRNISIKKEFVKL